MKALGQLLILTGPSCVGKTPLVKCLHSFFPDWMAPIGQLVLYNSRAPRPGERDGVDYHFRTREEIVRNDSSDDWIVLEARGDLQALNIARLNTDLASRSLLFEGNPFVARILQKDRRLADVPKKSIFVSPLSKEEIQALLAMETNLDPKAFLTDVMRRKLLRRTRLQKGELSLPDLETIERRASSAWTELELAPEFDCVVVNHDGEDSENWLGFSFPLGEARLCMHAVRAYFSSGEKRGIEKWAPGLVRKNGTKA